MKYKWGSFLLFSFFFLNAFLYLLFPSTELRDCKDDKLQDNGTSF